MTLFSSIVLSGGSTMFHQFGDRLLTRCGDLHPRKSRYASLPRQSVSSPHGSAAPSSHRWPLSKRCGYLKRSSRKMVFQYYTGRHSEWDALVHAASALAAPGSPCPWRGRVSVPRQKVVAVRVSDGGRMALGHTRRSE